MHLLESWHSSSLTAPYHWHPQNSSHSSIGCPLNGESDSNLSSWLSRHYTPTIRRTSPTFYSITSLPGPRVHLPVTYFHFHGTTFHLILVHFISRHLKSGTLENIIITIRCRLLLFFFYKLNVVLGVSQRATVNLPGRSTLSLIALWSELPLNRPTVNSSAVC